MNGPLVSIIVPTLQRPRALQNCLRSISETVHLPHEVIVVVVADDQSTFDVLHALKSKTTGSLGCETSFGTIIQPTRGGAVQAMNMGFRAARGEYLMQINDDCELLPHSVANAVRFLQAPANHMIGQAAFFHDSPPPRFAAANAANSPKQKSSGRRNVHAQIKVEDIWYFVYHVRGLCYANFGLAKRSLYERLGYLDERFFMYGADPDFSLKVWHEAKLRVEPCPGALVHHIELDDARAAAERPAQHGDNEKLFAKWHL